VESRKPSEAEDAAGTFWSLTKRIGRLADLRGLAAKVAWMRQAPLPDALDMRLAFEVIEVVGLLPPALLRVGFAGLATVGLGTEVLSPHVTVVGIVKRLAVCTFMLTG
jgi:hypothetical protein